MLIDPIYYAIFYDVDKPKDFINAMNKRINRRMFFNLDDDFSGKTVELKTHEGIIGSYKLISTTSFKIENSIDNNFFIICNVEKLFKHTKEVEE